MEPIKEDVARVVLDNQWPDGNKEKYMDEKLERLREKGIVNIRSINKAREYVKLNIGNFPYIGFLQHLYELAYEELEEENKCLKIIIDKLD